MRRNENFILRRVADMSVIVPLGAAARSVSGNDLSKRDRLHFYGTFWNRNRRSKALETPLCAVYSVEREQAEADAAAFLDKLRPVGAVDGL